MHESGFTQEQMRKFQEVDDRTLTKWKDAVILSLITKVPRGFRTMMPFNNWHEAMAFLRTELKELFLLHDLYAGDDSNEGFAINRKNPLPIDREHYALAINIARRLEVYDQANTIDNNKHLISEMIDKHYDVQSGDTIYISNIATVDRSDKNQILKDFEANFDLIPLLPKIGGIPP